MEQVYMIKGHLVHANNIKDNSIDKDDPWLGFLAAKAFTIFIKMG